MPGPKSHPTKGHHTFPKSKEKGLLNLEELNHHIMKASPKQNDKLIFEIKYFLIALTSISMQYLHIYRLNFYNYDFKLYIYSILIFSRRLILKIKQQREIVDPLNLDILTYIINGISYLLLFNGVYLVYQLMMQYSWSSLLVLLYFHIMITLASFFMYQEQRYDNVINEMNYLYKSTIFRCLEMIYFVIVLPLKCHDENLSFDLLTAIQIGIITLFNATIWNIFFQVCYRSEEMRKQSKTLGDWKAFYPTEKEQQNIEEWAPTKAPYKRNSVVCFNKKYYQAVSKYNAAVPGDIQFKLIYVISDCFIYQKHIFHDHKKTRIYLIFSMCASIIIQNLYLIYSYRGLVYIILLVQSFIVVLFMIQLDKRLQSLFK